MRISNSKRALIERAVRGVSVSTYISFRPESPMPENLQITTNVLTSSGVDEAVAVPIILAVMDQ